MKKIVTFLLSIILVVIIFNYWYNRQIFYPSGLISDFPNIGQYSINPDTIFTNLLEKDKEVFEAFPNLDNSNIIPLSYGSFPWGQSEYLIIMDALHQFRWRESLDDWDIYEMSFTKGCNDDSLGFDAASLLVYKIDEDNPTYYITHFLGIYPLIGVVEWGEGQFSRPLFGWQNIDLAKRKVTVDEALQVAEENGGKTFRLQNMNECITSLTIKPNPRNDLNWLILYNNNIGTSSLNIHVDSK
jgi:hypothetical protein